MRVIAAGMRENTFLFSPKVYALKMKIEHCRIFLNWRIDNSAAVWYNKREKSSVVLR